MAGPRDSIRDGGGEQENNRDSDGDPDAPSFRCAASAGRGAETETEGAPQAQERFVLGSKGRLAQRHRNSHEFRSAIAKSAAHSPFIRPRRTSLDRAHSSRVSALGAIRKDAVRAAAMEDSLLWSSPLSPASGRRPIEQSDAAPASALPGSPAPPSLHEPVRRVSSRPPLDGGSPCDGHVKSAFVHCLRLVCDENEACTADAYPRRGEADNLVLAVFPAEVARRYSPDFIAHVLSHMKLSRRGLAAALVYLDRAHSVTGAAMTVCNKNVNSLVLCALVIASRVIERGGCSDEVLAMLSGMPDAAAMRRAVAFCLDKLEWNASVTAADTGPYEDLLESLCAPGPADPTESELGHGQISSRNKALRRDYPPSAMDLK
jgi:hypothetical protein